MTDEERASIRMTTMARLYAECTAALAEETRLIEAAPGGTERSRIEHAAELEAMRVVVEAVRVLAESEKMRREDADCRCAGPRYHPDKPCLVHPENGRHSTPPGPGTTGGRR